MLLGLFAVGDHMIPHAWEICRKEDVSEQTLKAIMYLEVLNRSSYTFGLSTSSCSAVFRSSHRDIQWPPSTPRPRDVGVVPTRDDAGFTRLADDHRMRLIIIQVSQHHDINRWLPARLETREWPVPTRIPLLPKFFSTEKPDLSTRWLDLSV